MISVFNPVLRAAVILMASVASVVAIAPIPATAQLEMLPQRPSRPATPARPPAADPAQQPAAPSPARIAPQLAGCRDWVSRALSDVDRSNIDVAPFAAQPIDGVIAIQWRIQDGTERGFCRVRRNGSILEAVMYTPDGIVHYFPTDSNDVGEPIL